VVPAEPKVQVLAAVADLILRMAAIRSWIVEKPGPIIPGDRSPKNRTIG
jgi:hypothetical protein